MMNNGFNNGYPGGYYSGMVYQQPNTQINMTQGLTPEQLKSLRKTGGFNLEITEEELLRAYCTHRTETNFATTVDDEGNFICSLCGTKFAPFEGSPADARELIAKTLDLLETTKTRAIGLPPRVIHDVFQIEPVLKRIPDLYSQALNDYNRVMGSDGGYVYGQENNAFAAYQNMVNPMGGAGYYDPAMASQYVQPMYGASVQPDMMGGQPMYGQGQQQGFNGGPTYGQPGFGGQPMYGQGQQQDNPFQQKQPMPQNGNGNNQQPSEAETVTVTKKMTD